jgi:hypothetical protein
MNRCDSFKERPAGRWLRLPVSSELVTHLTQGVGLTPSPLAEATAGCLGVGSARVSCVR